MSQGTPRISGPGAVGLYLFAALLIFWPPIDLVTTAWPPQPGELGWRYGFMGLLANFLHTPILGLVLALILAYLLRHRVLFRVVAIVCLVSALSLLAVSVLFPLDVLQMRGGQPPERLPSFQAGAIIAELKHLTALAVLTLLGIGGWTMAGRETWEGKGSRSSSRQSDLVVKPAKKAQEQPVE